jgi:hypothetical protein
LLHKSSCLAAALGVTKFITVIAMNSVTVCVLLWQTCDMYYKHMTIVNDNASVVSEQSF